MHRERHHADQQAEGDAHGEIPVFPVCNALFLWMYGQWVHDQLLVNVAICLKNILLS